MGYNLQDIDAEIARRKQTKTSGYSLEDIDAEISRRQNPVQREWGKWTSNPGEGFGNLGWGAAKGLGDTADAIGGLGELVAPIVTGGASYLMPKPKQKFSLGNWVEEQRIKSQDSLEDPSMPLTHGFGEFAAPALLPAPSAIGQAKSVGQAFKIGGIEGGLLSGLTNIGQQQTQKGFVDPVEGLVATGAGGLLGGTASAGLKGIGNAWAKRFGPKMPEPEPELPAWSYDDVPAPVKAGQARPAQRQVKPLPNYGDGIADSVSNISAPQTAGALANADNLLGRGLINTAALDEADLEAMSIMRRMLSEPAVSDSRIPNVEPPVVSRLPEPEPPILQSRQNVGETVGIPNSIETPNLLHSKLPDFTEQPPTNIRWQEASPEQPVLPIGETAGDARFQLETVDGVKQLGSQRGLLGQALDAFAQHMSPEQRALILQYGGLKKALSLVEARNKRLAEDIWQRLPEEQRLGGAAQVGKHFIQDMPDEMRLSYEGQQKADALKYDYADKLGAPVGGGIRATLSGEPTFDPYVLPEDPNAFGPLIEKAIRHQTNLEKRFKELRGRITKDDITGKIQTALRANDPNAQFQASLEFPGGVKVNVEHQNPQVRKGFIWEDFKKSNLSKEAFFTKLAEHAGQGVDEFAQAVQGRYDAYREGLKAIQSQFTKTKPRGPEIKKNTTRNRVSAVLAAGGVGAMSTDQAASAADPNASVNRRIGAGTIGGVGLLVAAAAMKNPLIFRQFIKSGTDKIAFLYRDTLDHVQALDEALQAAGVQATPLARRMMEHNVAAMQSTWGVHFKSQNLKAAALEALKTKAVTPVDALNGAGVFDKLNPAQRKAVTTYYLTRKSLGREVKQYVEQVRQQFPNPDAVPFNLKESLRAVNMLDESLNGAPQSTNALSEGMSHMLGNAMDYYFNLNPKHHLLNLTDSVIAGASRVGPVRMFAANHELIANPRLQKLFKDSNLVGGYKGDTSYYLAQAANKQGKAPKDTFDFKTDQFNAERVALASFFQYFDANAAALKKNGIKSGVDFAEKLLDNKIANPDTAMDAWVQMADNNLRTMGVDPFKTNKHFFNRMRESSVLGVFINQPSRIARLGWEYVNQGQVGKLAVMLGAITALGGAAAIPSDLAYVWKNNDANGYESYAAALDSVSLGGLVANNVPGAAPWVRSLTDKVGYGIIPGTQAAFHPALGMASQNLGGLAGAVKSGDVGAGAMAAAKLASLATSRIPFTQLPIGQTVRTIEGVQQAMSGELPVSHYGKGINPIPGAGDKQFGDQKFANKQFLDLTSIPGGQAIPIANIVLPGEPYIVQQMQKYEEEHKLRKDQKHSVPAIEQAYPKPKVRTKSKKKH